MDPTTATEFDWEKIMFVQGPLYVIFLLLLYGIIKYVPSLVSSHQMLIKTLEETSKQNALASLQTADSTERMSESLDKLSHATEHTHDDLKQIKRGIRCGVAAGRAVLLESGHAKDSDVVLELDKGMRALNHDDDSNSKR